MLVGGDDADVGNADGLVQLLGQLAAVEHDLHGLGCVEPGRVVTLPHLGGLERRETPAVNKGAAANDAFYSPK